MAALSKIIVFQLNQQQYGVDIHQVMSIEKLVNITEVPKTSDFIKGIINLRGEITPIIDLRERLNIGKTTHTNDTRVLIVNVRGVRVGLIVDAATDVIDIDASVIEPAPEIIGGVHESFLKGVARLEESLLILLDLEHILNLEEINEAEKVKQED